MSMQRKLTAALVGVALAAIVLVGAGVLVFAQIGARDDAHTAVVEQLNALVNVTQRAESSSLQTLEPTLRRLGEAFDDGEVTVALVDELGALVPVPARGNEGRSSLGGFDSVRLDDELLASFVGGEVVTIDDGRSVVGLVAVVDDTPNRPAGHPAILVRRSVGALPPRTFVWFGLSAAIVLIASALFAAWLARRFTRPIRSIEQATTAIASGRLDTRVAVTGTDEVGQLASSVNSMAADLERSRAAEQQFLLSITHDLRTPLTSIAGYAEALEDGAAIEPARAGTIISANAARLDRLVGDLLTLARLQAHSFTFHPADVDAAELSTELALDRQQRVDGYDLSLSFENLAHQPVRCTLDPDRARQAIDNLLDNAIKFASTSVVLRLEADADCVRISVIDDGPGIPADDLPFVFERLYVTKLQPVRAETSSGLGLAIVRELVEGMGGSVSAAASGVGTTMTLTFPRLR